MHEISVSKEVIQNKIYTLRAMTRNIKRFPESFRFQITKDEYDEILRYQFGTSSIGHGGRRKCIKL